jgi:hypothetical protein
MGRISAGVWLKLKMTSLFGELITELPPNLCDLGEKKTLTVIRREKGKERTNWEADGGGSP